MKVSKEIGAPVDVVFQRFTDIQRGPEHVSNIKNVQVLTPGPFGLHTRWRESREVIGRLDDAEMEVTSFEKNRHYTITHQKAGVKIDTVFTFEPIPTGTRVSVEFALRNEGLPPGLLAPVEWAIAGKVRDVLSNDLADLKSSVERLAAAS
ncbi:MAG: SRPBCC family protein [Acidobacteria bacterium]|nr:SRPBCC family protein [Acidobacteriota bacterium]